ncbi:helix-turn-helix domain-containing protein [Rugosimonospora africana]|uniref:Transcriptional regulator n=1 Tax=Rugosimonospora africana TaxID=556532 RepID=A0A8J3VV33_9ACTN|nr:helix-turn-helix transcriptional regulator [Rugosimonospora africana]GIH19391.1 transcriptional regulator [Rugosimonospora africana]
MLEGLGLRPQQEQAYLHLLDNPRLSAAGLVARRPEWTSAQAEAVLRSLVPLGLAVPNDQTGDTYAAIAPDVALAALVRARVDAARSAERAVPELMALFWQGRPEPESLHFIDVVTDEHSITERWYQLQRAAQREVRGFDCPPYFADPTDPDPIELQRLAEGVSYRVIYADEVLEQPGRWRDLEAGIAAGEQARVAHRLPVKLTLFDDFAATLPVKGQMDGAGERSRAVIVVHRSPLLDALSALFEVYWDQAAPLPGEPDGGATSTSTGLYADDARLVRLLAAGFGNETIGRALGVSSSTVQRRVHELMERLGAKTRFQAGLILGRLGSVSKGTPAGSEPAAGVSAADDRLAGRTRRAAH